MPLIHRDPFDRLLVAQAIAEPAILYTSDAQLAAWMEDVGFASPRVVPLPPDPHAKGPGLFTARATKRADLSLS